MKRTFYFLKDNVTSKFYWSHKYLESLVELDGASVYHNETNAKKMLRQIVTKWEWTESSVDVWIAGTYSVEYGKTMKQMVNQRKNLPNWGIEIVSGEVNIY
jgi:NADPH-dependent ferric siderophore reductase